MLNERDSARFMAKTAAQPDGCCLWTGAKTNGSVRYGQFYLNKRLHLAHRVMHEWRIGPIPEGLEVDHRCGNSLCVNPYHLEAVTPIVNKHRSRNQVATNRLKTHCPQGHPYDEANTIYYGHQRRCRTCKQRHDLERHHARMGQVRENELLKERIAALEAAIRHTVASGQPLNWFYKDVARCAWCGCFAEREPHYRLCPWTELTEAIAEK